MREAERRMETHDEAKWAEFLESDYNRRKVDKIASGEKSVIGRWYMADLKDDMEESDLAETELLYSNDPTDDPENPITFVENGLSSAKTSFLERLGWRVVQIPFYEWHTLQTDLERERYLHVKIFRRRAFHEIEAGGAGAGDDEQDANGSDFEEEDVDSEVEMEIQRAIEEES